MAPGTTFEATQGKLCLIFAVPLLVVKRLELIPGVASGHCEGSRKSESQFRVFPHVFIRQAFSAREFTYKYGQMSQDLLTWKAPVFNDNVSTEMMNIEPLSLELRRWQDVCGRQYPQIISESWPNDYFTNWGLRTVWSWKDLQCATVRLELRHVFYTNRDGHVLQLLQFSVRGDVYRSSFLCWWWDGRWPMPWRKSSFEMWA